MAGCRVKRAVPCARASTRPHTIRFRWCSMGTGRGTTRRRRECRAIDVAFNRGVRRAARCGVELRCFSQVRRGARGPGLATTTTTSGATSRG